MAIEQTWEYVVVTAVGTKGSANDPELSVTSSDRQWQGAKMANKPANIAAVFNKLGAKGWELVGSPWPSPPEGSATVLRATFRRPGKGR